MRRARALAGAILAAAALSLLIAAPQIATTWQSFRGSTRDVAPFSFAAATGTSVHAARLLEQVTPFPFGRPDLTGPLGFHGHRFYDNHAPYLWTLHLGWATLALLLRHGRPLARGERVWWMAAAVGVVLSLGHHLPAARMLVRGAVPRRPACAFPSSGGTSSRCAWWCRWRAPRRASTKGAAGTGAARWRPR